MPSSVFAKVPSELNFPKEERDILALWKSSHIFAKSLEARPDAPTFVFYEGPPTANGTPHNGHVLTRVIKDLFPRYKTMRGYRVPRKAGWDTHGLPVEVEVEKELRIHGKAAIEEYGVEPFAKKCIESVFRYTEEWERLTERIGFWVDLPTAYVTFHKQYVESVWWALSELFKKGLLYQGHKVVWWWAQGGTALSSGEVGQGYKEVDDPSVYVRFPLVDAAGDLADASLLVWTTTPWTLSSNMYAAINAKFDYALVESEKSGHKLVVAKGLLETLGKKLGALKVVRDVKASEFSGKHYAPPFDTFTKEAEPRKDVIWSVIEADFVTLDAGTGIVHIAPAFGEDDHVAHRKLLATKGDIPLLCAVKADGTFIAEMGKYAGRWVKDCDKELSHELKERGLLLHAETYRHDYPFCWRADSDPLIQFARPAWYIKTTALIDKAIANNRTIQWLPDHIKEGRFGDFLANNVDWALSRERYWGTPLNVWICSKDATHMHAPSSVAEIEKLNASAFEHFHAAKKKDPSLSDHLIVHKPWIDEVKFPCPTCKAEMKRVPEVIDCWFDSGCMPFAQWGFPHTGRDKFAESFPADFISEAIDQTRGWFYSLLMISTLVFDDECQKRLGLAKARPFPHPFKTCIVLGHVCDKEGKKESKSKGNYTPPDLILDQVKMEFGVLAPKDAGVDAKDGTAFIARDDLEGLDLQEGATIRLYRADAPGKAVELKIAAAKKLRRRVVVLSDKDREAVGAAHTKTIDVKPVEVPRLPQAERVVVEDPTSPAPGADAFRWFFYASSPPWSNTRHALSNVRALQKDFLVKLRNVYSFFTIYANIDGFVPGAKPEIAHAKRSELDRWIASELAITADGVTKDLDGYDVYAATQKLMAFVDAISNWYVRRSRDRFWKSGWDDDKQSAYETLYECLTTLTGLIAPFVPFTAEGMYQNLVAGPAKQAGRGASESVHLTDFPKAKTDLIDRALSSRMSAVRDLVSLGLQVRTQAKLKVRQPLRKAHLVVSDPGLRDGLRAAEAMIREELNVLGVHFVPDAEVGSFVEHALKPNFRSLGQRGLGKEAQQLKKHMAELKADAATKLLAEIDTKGKATLLGVELSRDDVEVAFSTKAGFAAAGDRVGVVVLETTLDDELKDLGFVRELQNRLQTARKEMGLEYTDRIKVAVRGGDRVGRIVGAYKADLAAEVLAASLEIGASPAGAVERVVDVEGESVTIAVIKA